MRSALAVIGLAWLGLVPWAADAPFAIDLELTPAAGQKTVVSASMSARPRGVERTVAHVASGDLLTVRLNVTRNTDPSAEDVTVHFFVVREARLGQEEVPDLKPERVLVEGASTMDFKVKDNTQTTFSFRVKEPGAYLVRAETLSPDNALMTTSFAALELEVK